MIKQSRHANHNRHENCHHTERAVHAEIPNQLCKELKKMLRKLRQQYLLANAGVMRTPVEEWLCDNYYVLEKEGKEVLKEIRQIARQGNQPQLMQMYRVIADQFVRQRPEITDATLIALLETRKADASITEQQFGFVRVSIQASLLILAYSSVFDTQDTDQMAYAITGCNQLSSLDMQAVIEACSEVEKIYRQDPDGTYPNMTQDSRAYYRYLTAKIAHIHKHTEQETAAALLAQAKTENRHVGFTLLHHPVWVEAKQKRGKYALLWGGVLPLVLSIFLGVWTGDAVVSVLCFLPLWEILRIPIQQMALAGVEVDYIPRMHLEKVQEKPATAVLVSTLLPKADQAPALGKRLEQLFFSNSDPNMYYCILADLGEWEYPTDEKDPSQIAVVRKMIEDLNRVHGPKFMLFLRARVYNPTQQRYSGWERKRGAITEFVRFLYGEKTSLHTFVGDRSVLPRIRYLIALDSDTNMLYESGQTLVAAAMHPVNKPVLDADGVVRSGYGILIPQISTDLHSAKATAFSRVMNGCGGVTAYDTRNKDFYQDLFGESIFAGKGLLHVEAFHAALNERFPEGRVLSHDILEGAYLRCGFVSDVEMTDGAPTSMGAWFVRLHRWLRGDWQNIVFIGRRYKADQTWWQNPISNLSKYKLFDNLRRSLSPVAAMLCLIAALFSAPPASTVLAVAGVLSVVFSSLWAAAWSLTAGGIFSVSRKFFTRTLPHTMERIGQALCLLVMLPYQAMLTADAAIRSLWRIFVTQKKMLEWTTAAQGESRAGSFYSVVRRFWFAELLGVLYCILCILTLQSPLGLLGICFVLLLPVAYYTAQPTREEGGRLSEADRDTLLRYNAAMWRYYEMFANAQHHFLPPDNVQHSPVYRVAARTSPTNIGMMLLSILAAHDFGFLDTDGLYLRVERTLSTVEGLVKWHGNLYNWYDTESLETLHPAFVSTVDSGNFVCCLVALKEGLRECIGEKPAFVHLIRRIEQMIDDTDLAVFYNKKKHLFSIGWEAETAHLVDAHYDFLMSEARLTSYFAVARKVVGKKHWGAMGRAMSRWGSYAGPVSWTGTMFEYFMPHLLLPVYEGSLLGEGLLYCLYCHKRRAKAADVPWGISESAFYAFDNNLNYQYKAHGVQRLGVKRYLDKELVISPYSTFVTLPFNPNSAMRNLARLHALGVYAQYGFYEAVDLTSERVGAGSLAVTRSYMAHHIGMSMIASCNALYDFNMQKRFMRDAYMGCGKEFLQEKIAKSSVVYDTLESEELRMEKQQPAYMQEEECAPNPLAPLCTLLTNGELTEIVTDMGAGWLCFGGIDLTRRDTDLLRRGQGLLTVVRMNGITLPSAQAPFYHRKAAYSMQQQEQCVTYLASLDELEIGVRSFIHPTISCTQRQIVVKNHTGTKQIAEVLCYFEPVLAAWQDYSAHPAYSKLFVSAQYDEQSRTLTFSRRNRDSSVDMYLTVGFLQEIAFQFEVRKEALLSAPDGMEGLLHFADKPFRCDAAAGTPDCCCALRFDLLVGAGAQQQATLLISAARSLEEGVQNIIAMRKIGVMDAKSGAKSPLLGASLEARLGEAALGQLLWTTAGAYENQAEKQRNRLGQNALWSTGISGDFPIALLELSRQQDFTALEGYVRLHTILRRLGVLFDLVVLCADAQQQEQCRLLVERHSTLGVISARGGIYPLHTETLSPEILTLLRAVARHTEGKGVPWVRSQCPGVYRPVLLRAVAPTAMPPTPECTVEGGAFDGGRFYVDKQLSPLPWNHILTNAQFGTLVSDHALGYTWAVNSRENKLTPWYNDIATDNTGEMLVLQDGDSYYQLTHGARASFGTQDARWAGTTPKIASDVVVHVNGAGCVKYIDVCLRNRTDGDCALECAYYIEPVLGVSRETARYIRPEVVGDVLTLHNPYQSAVQSWAALRAEAQEADPVRFMVDRAAFLCGDWQSVAIVPNNDPCAALIVPMTLAPKETRTVRFMLGYGKQQESAVYMVTQAPDQPQSQPHSIWIDTPDVPLNQMMNHFLPHQILHSRIQGRSAFYQCGGAYGFRDQLQDVSAYIWLDPEIAKRQILRCCGVQFEQGDVLHWWHALPKSGGGIKGVRTRFSDDLLWLPLVVSEYVEKTGDYSVLDLQVGYLSAPELAPGEQEQYLSPARSALREDVFSHCIRALERGHRLGENGLPLIGCGDWNDGLSFVGKKGKGTSVWMGMFLAMVLTRFSRVCAQRGEAAREKHYLAQAEKLRGAIDACAWDGQWYLRAFFDDGEPIGSHRSEECQIDLLPQSFAVFAAMPDTVRVDSGLQSAYDRLVDHKLRLVQLFDPPFQHSHQQPGYIKAYPTGIRENGGQYTHSAIWFAMALIAYGRVDDGWKILEMLNPADRARFPALAKQYALEPYSMPADIYTHPGAAGRGGWSMYTGAASWYYRAIVESLLGIRWQGDRITLSPRLPSHWQEVRVKLVLRDTPINLHISRQAVHGLCCDGHAAEHILLDGKAHEAVLGILGKNSQ